jgi:hypothetical protein
MEFLSTEWIMILLIIALFAFWAKLSAIHDLLKIVHRMEYKTIHGKYPEEE